MAEATDLADCSTRSGRPAPRGDRSARGRGRFDVGQLERLLARHEVKLAALQTACRTPPTGHLEERRDRLAELAIERNFFVLEDRVYADANFTREPVRFARASLPWLT